MSMLSTEPPTSHPEVGSRSLIKMADKVDQEM